MKANDMTIMDQVKEYLSNKDFGEPIFLTDMAHEFSTNQEYEKTRNTISTYLNRLSKRKELKKFEDGIFYKAKKNKFGENLIDYTKLIECVYLFDSEENEIIGYRIGASVLSKMGITNNLENKIIIVTNNYKRTKVLSKINQTIVLKRPVTKINSSNYQYLQLLDTLKLIPNYHLTIDNSGKKIVEYLQENHLRIDLLFKYAKELYSNQVITDLVNLLAT